MQAAYVAVKYMSMVRKRKAERQKGRKAGRQEGGKVGRQKVGRLEAREVFRGTIARVASYMKAEE
jgi:hypothetical protein